MSGAPAEPFFPVSRRLRLRVAVVAGLGGVAAFLTFVVSGGNGPRISDGVDQATMRASDTFPYLAPPNPVPAAAGRFLPSQFRGVGEHGGGDLAAQPSPGERRTDVRVS